MRPILEEEIRREKCNQSMLSGYNQAVASGLIEQGEKMPEEEKEYVRGRAIVKENPLNKMLGEDFDRILQEHFGGDEHKMMNAYGYGLKPDWWKEKIKVIKTKKR